MSALPRLQDSVAQTIFDAGTKIIYSNVVVPTDIYLMREAMRYTVMCLVVDWWLITGLRSNLPKSVYDNKALVIYGLISPR